MLYLTKNLKLFINYPFVCFNFVEINKNGPIENIRTKMNKFA